MGTIASGFDKFATMFMKSKEEERKNKFELIKFKLKEQYEDKKAQRVLDEKRQYESQKLQEKRAFDVQKRDEERKYKSGQTQQKAHEEDPWKFFTNQRVMEEYPITGLGKTAQETQVYADQDPSNEGGFIIDQPASMQTQYLPTDEEGEMRQLPITSQMNMPYMQKFEEKLQKAKRGEGAMPSKGEINLYQGMVERLAKMQEKKEKESAPLTWGQAYSMGTTAAKKNQWSTPSGDEIWAETQKIAKRHGMKLKSRKEVEEIVKIETDLPDASKYKEGTVANSDGIEYAVKNRKWVKI